MHSQQYVQYGCGTSAPEGWINFDASPTLRFERLPVVGRLYTRNSVRFPKSVEYGDIVLGLPLKAASCRGVYCSHVLEHLSLESFRVALRNTYALLESNGTFRLVLPDLRLLAQRYLEDSTSQAAITFMQASYLGIEKRPRGVKGVVVSLLGNSQHLWMWDYESIKEELGKAGFTQIRRAQFGDSADLFFQRVEDKIRWDDCLGVECKK